MSAGVRLPGQPVHSRPGADDWRCRFHSEAVPVYICTECRAPLCDACAKRPAAYHIRICTACGSLCVPLANYRESIRLARDRESPFGLNDFSLALRYPFQRTLTFGLAAIAYGACHFSLAFFALDKVGILLGGIGAFPVLAANSMMFEYMSRIIAQIEQGKPGVSEVFDDTSLLAEFPDIALLGLATLAAVAWPYILLSELQVTSPVTLGVLVIWAVVYYPACTLVRAISHSFWSILNPLAGFAAIVKMGRTYLSLFLMYVSLVVLFGAPIAYVSVYTVEGGFSLPTYLVLGIIFGPPVFYLNIVLAFLIGRALLKSGEQSGP